MKGNSVRRMDMWFVWNYEKEQQRLDGLSEQGLHLKKPGLFRSEFIQDSEHRYVYRLDYQPQLKKRVDVQDYLDLYQGAGWEYIGQCQKWRYFRRPWGAEGVTEIYTDRDSLLQHYRRIQSMLALLVIAEFIILATNTYNLLVLPVGHHRLSFVAPVLIPLSVVTLLLGYGVIAIQRIVGRMQKR